MTREEIKSSVTIAEVLQRYGIQVPRSRFISCPFHQEKTASCYIEQKSYHCFGCGAHGDVFSLVQQMEGVSFKEAFLSLGGEYEKPVSRAEAYARNLRLAELRRKQSVKDNEIKLCKQALLKASRDMETWRPFLTLFKPLADDWSYAMEKYSSAVNAYDNACEELERLRDDGGW